MANPLLITFLPAFVLTASLIQQGSTLVFGRDSDLCGDWINYNNEKCLKIMDAAYSKGKDDAEKICTALSKTFKGKNTSRLVTIKNSEQQKFIHQLLANIKMNADVWLGLFHNNLTSQLEWNDGSRFSFSNLIFPNTTDSNNNQCFQMNINDRGGAWHQVSCTKLNRIVCEQDIQWPLANLQEVQRDSNYSEREWPSLNSEKVCKEKIMTSKHTTDFLKEVTKKSLEGLKDLTDMLKDAEDKIADLEKSEKRMKELDYDSGSSASIVDDSSLCGQWTPYKDEMCLKIVETVGTVKQEDAGKACSKLSAQLLTIKTREEQEALQQFLFTKNGIVDNVWLGVKKESSGQFEWNDGSQITFSNWANQTVVDEQKECVEMKPSDGLIQAGLWFKVTCKRKNAVVCQKRPTWNLITLQNALLNFKLEQQTNEKAGLQKQEKLREIVVKSEAKISLLENQIKQNQIPLGFIYAQLPDHNPPAILWPHVKWLDVSSNYAGLFFRVIGGKAAGFGQIQEETSPRLEGVIHKDSYDAMNITIPADGTWSKSVLTGYSGTSAGIRFRYSTAETRPRNKSIRIWKRI